MNLLEIRDVLLTVTSKVYHFEAPAGETGKYIVWAEDGETDLHADDKIEARVTEGTIDLFTPDEYDSMPQKISEALDRSGVSHKLNSIQKETDTGLIHYEWVFEIG